jgi:hypothetical protein
MFIGDFMAAIDRTPSTPVVCDAGPLIHLDEVGCLDLLDLVLQNPMPADLDLLV